MPWMALIQLLSQLAIEVVKILASPNRSGYEPARLADLPPPTREKFVELADMIKKEV